MINYNILKQLVLEAFTANPFMPVSDVLPDVEKLAAHHNVFPSREDCQKMDINYDDYGNKRLAPIDRQKVNYIIWGLIRENLLVIDEDRRN